MNIDSDPMLGLALYAMYYGCPTLTLHVYGKSFMSIRLCVNLGVLNESAVMCI